MRAGSPAGRKELAEQIQVVACDEAPYVPWGQYVQPHPRNANAGER